MKLLIAAVALSSLAFSASALEIGKPFEQIDLDRALPNVTDHAGQASVGSTQSSASAWANDYNFIAPAL